MRARYLGIAALVALILAIFTTSVHATSRLGASPHARPDACASCHTLTAAGQVDEARPTEESCRGCHPDADMHPVGMAPREVAVPADWPLEAGKVGCATCHAEPACAADRGKVSPWLRGGVPERKMDFCFRCHATERMERSNPHVASPDGSSCAACHTNRPVPGASVAGARLRLDPGEVCATCHPGPVHAGVTEHLGAVPTGLGPDVASRLPLTEGGAIACWTCHDVHQLTPDVHPAPSALAGRISAARGLQTGDHAALLAMPVSDGSLCRACHGSGP